MMETLEYTYVLNVKKFIQRRQFMEKQLTNASIKAEFIFDYDIDDLSDQLIEQYFIGDRLSKAQMSCALKHVTALQKISKNNSQFNLVLEDDALFSDDFATGLQHTLQESKLFKGDKVIYIGSGGNFYTPKSQRVAGKHLYVGSRGRFADSYILDSATAQKRLDWIAQHKISKPIDNQFETMDKALGIKIIWLEDPVVEQGSKNGLFDSALESAPPRWLQGMYFRWEKLKRKYIYQLYR